MPIFDQGYQHWNGRLAGQAWRWLVITRHGVRTQLKNWAVRLLLLVAWLPAFGLVTYLALWGLVEQKSESVMAWLGPFLTEQPGLVANPATYRRAVWTLGYSYFFWIELFLIMLVVVAIGPGLISRDLRFNALPLYFSRPLRRFDYFVGKLGVIGALVAAVAVAPAVLAYFMGVCFSLDVTVIRDTYWLVPASILYGLVITICVGTLMLALSSLSRRSLLVGIAWLAIWVIGGSVTATLVVIHEAAMWRQAFGAEDAAPKQKPPPRKGKASAFDMLNQQSEERKFALRMAKYERALAEAARTDWRPLFSLRLNMERIGEWLLGTDAAYVELAHAADTPQRVTGALGIPSLAPAEPPPNERRFADARTPQYPWIWSAGVLAAICGASIWILSLRVKSLDRLK